MSEMNYEAVNATEATTEATGFVADNAFNATPYMGYEAPATQMDSYNPEPATTAAPAHNFGDMATGAGIGLVFGFLVDRVANAVKVKKAEKKMYESMGQEVKTEVKWQLPFRMPWRVEKTVIAKPAQPAPAPAVAPSAPLPNATPAQSAPAETSTDTAQ